MPGFDILRTRPHRQVWQPVRVGFDLTTRFRFVGPSAVTWAMLGSSPIFVALATSRASLLPTMLRGEGVGIHKACGARRVRRLGISILHLLRNTFPKATSLQFLYLDLEPPLHCHFYL